METMDSSWDGEAIWETLWKLNNQCADIIVMKTTIASLIRKERTRLGLSTRDLAHKAGVSHTAIADVEVGRRKPSVALLMKICQTLTNEGKNEQLL
jgi:predicted transcriptional regulator